MWSNFTSANAAARHGFRAVPGHQESAPPAKPPTGTRQRREAKFDDYMRHANPSPPYAKHASASITHQTSAARKVVVILIVGGIFIGGIAPFSLIQEWQEQQHEQSVFNHMSSWAGR